MCKGPVTHLRERKSVWQKQSEREREREWWKVSSGNKAKADHVRRGIWVLFHVSRQTIGWLTALK